MSAADTNLHTYLHDHTAGARQAVELLKALAGHHGMTLVGLFAEKLGTEIAQDLRTLESLAAQLGAGGFEVKELAGWLADKLSRLKLMPLTEPFHTFESLEFLTLGILGKRALWRALAQLAPARAELRSIDFDQLLERAEEQYRATEEVRLQMAAEVFG